MRWLRSTGQLLWASSDAWGSSLLVDVGAEGVIVTGGKAVVRRDADGLVLASTLFDMSDGKNLGNPGLARAWGAMSW
jgi:hypothetical protein